MFNDKKPDKSQIGAIDPECDVLSVLQGFSYLFIY
jgi:hypothetical protein